MFASKNSGTVIAKGLKIVGSVTAEGLVEVNGEIDGEIHCTSLVVSRGAQIVGSITADRVVVDGHVEGPIQGKDITLKSQSHVIGDVHSDSLMIENGAYFEGRSAHGSKANRREARQDAKRGHPEVTAAE
jgi:cytoskeletal protein CcmA (bactofilin family)